MSNIAVIDCEAQSSSTSTGKIISISGILYNDNFQELDRFEFFCNGNIPGYCPDPYSLWVNKGLKKYKESNMSHYSMMLALHEIIQKWSPCIWATWNGHGYDYPLIEKENYRSLLPIYVLKTGGNEAADFLPWARAAKLFFPESLKTTFSKSANPVFKLADLGMQNFPELDKSKFHTATQDVEVSAKVMNKFRSTAKPIYDSAFLSTSKDKAKKLITGNELFTTVLYFFGKARAFACTYLFDHKKYFWPMVYCLETDPNELIKLSYYDLKEKMKKPGKFLRAIPLKHPVILNISFSQKEPMYAQIGMEKLKERAKIIKDNPKFLENCSKALLEIAEEKELSKKKKNDKTSKDPHNQLYSGGFPENKDQEIMKKFHTVDWSQRFSLLQSLKDERFKYFGERLIYQNQPETLPQKDFDRIHIETAKRLLSLEEESFTTIPMAEQLIDNIRAEKDISSEKLEYMNEIDEMIKEMRIKYEKAVA